MKDTSLPPKRMIGLPRAALYLRRSEEETGENFSISTQERACRGKADLVLGPGRYTVVGVLKDEGRSGKLGLRRPGVSPRNCREGLSELVEMVTRDEVDDIFLYRLDRLSRRQRLTITLLEDYFIPHGVRLHSASEEIDLDSAGGNLMVQMLGSIAELYSRQAAERTRDGMANRLSLGFPLGFGCYGWQLPPKPEGGGRRTLTRAPEEGRVLLQMRDWLLSGWGGDRIAAELNRRGIPTYRGLPRWSSVTIVRLLKNPTHAGLVRVEGELRPGNFADEAYWDRQTYEHILAEISRRRRVPRRTAGAPQYLLSPQLCCRGCGRRMYALTIDAKSGGPVAYYRCQTDPSAPGCHTPWAKAALVESAVITELARIAASEELRTLAEQELARLVEDGDRSRQDRRRQLKQRERKTEEQLDKWSEQLTLGTVTQERFNAFNAKLWSQLQQCREELAELEKARQDRSRREAHLSEMREALRDFDAIWGELDQDQRRHLVGLLIDKIALEWKGHDSVLYIKPYYLPERALIVECRSRKRDAPRTGLDSLTARDLSVLHLLDAGLTREAVAQHLDLAVEVVDVRLWAIRKRMGLSDLKQILELTRPHIAARLHLLPVNGRVTARRVAAAQEPDELTKSALRLRARTGASMQRIARELGCKPNSLPARFRRWYRRLGVHRLDDLVAEAERRGWIPSGKKGANDGDTSES